MGTISGLWNWHHQAGGTRRPGNWKLYATSDGKRRAGNSSKRSTPTIIHLLMVKPGVAIRQVATSL